MNIIKNNNFRYHNTSPRTAAIIYLVTHFTANDGGTAENHIDYFNNPTTTAGSADFFTDKISKRQYNTQLESRYSWAVGVDYSNGRAPYQGKCTNNNSISIEMCCELRNGKWYIDEKTYKNTLELTKYLMKKYNIPPERVIRHYDVCYKDCPNVYGWLKSTGSEATWKKFKAELNGDNSNINATTDKTDTAEKTNLYRVRKSWEDKASQLGAFEELENAKEMANKHKGYNVYDSKGKVVYSPADKHPENGSDTATTTKFKPYTVKVTADVLNVRKGAGTNYAVTTTIRRNEVYTIVAESNGWGKLKSGAGWICLDYTVKT